MRRQSSLQRRLPISEPFWPLSLGSWRCHSYFAFLYYIRLPHWGRKSISSSMVALMVNLYIKRMTYFEFTLSFSNGRWRSAKLCDVKCSWGRVRGCKVTSCPWLESHHTGGLFHTVLYKTTETHGWWQPTLYCMQQQQNFRIELKSLKKKTLYRDLHTFCFLPGAKTCCPKISIKMSLVRDYHVCLLWFFLHALIDT